MRRRSLALFALSLALVGGSLGGAAAEDGEQGEAQAPVAQPVQTAPDPADDADKLMRLAQLKKLAEAKKKADAEKLRQAMTPPKLEEGDILMSGRSGVNQLINGHFKLNSQVFNGRPSYIKQKPDRKGPEAVDLAVWWSNGKWYVGLMSEIGTDAAYAFVPSQAQLPDAANSVWSIWDGSKWLADPRIKCTGTGSRRLHVGTAKHQADDDDDEEEYARDMERRQRAEAGGQQNIPYDDDDDDYAPPTMKERLAQIKQQAQARGPDDPEPVPKPHHVPKRVKFHATCPEGHAGCSARNLCKECPNECETCQNVRYTKRGLCSKSDCFTCRHGYKHVQKFSDGRGRCVSAGSGYFSYVLIGIVVVAMVGFALYMFLANKQQSARRRGILPRHSQG